MTIQRSRKDSTFHGRFMPKGTYFGGDDKGVFMATRVLKWGDDRYMRMYRLNVRRGWVAQWEQGKTAVAVRRRMVADDPHVRFKHELDVTGYAHNL